MPRSDQSGEVYRVEASVASRDAAMILRELIEDNVDCDLTAFDRIEVDDATE